MERRISEEEGIQSGWSVSNRRATTGLEVFHYTTFASCMLSCNHNDYWRWYCYFEVCYRTTYRRTRPTNYSRITPQFTHIDRLRPLLSTGQDEMVEYMQYFVDTVMQHNFS